eukprot:scaffold2.g6962.t1
MPRKAYHVANRDIAEGEMITTNYLMAGTLASTPKRRQVLATEKLFRCRCSRCTTEPDRFRRLPCPACAPQDAATGMLATPLRFGSLDPPTSTFAFDSAVCSHYIVCHMAEVEAGAAEPWHCAGCGTAFADRAVALFPAAVLSRWGRHPEQHFEEQVDELDRMMGQGREPPLPVMQQLYEEICGVLGCQHWLLYKLLRIQIEYRVEDIKYKPMAQGMFFQMGPVLGSHLGSTPTRTLLSDIEQKAAMLWAWGTTVLHQRNFAYLAYSELSGAMEKLRCLDFQGFKCQQLLVKWGRLAKVVQGRDVKSFWTKAYKPVWRQLLGVGAAGGRVRRESLHLFKDEEEKAEFVRWLKKAADLKG